MSSKKKLKIPLETIQSKLEASVIECSKIEGFGIPKKIVTQNYTLLNIDHPKYRNNKNKNNYSSLMVKIPETDSYASYVVVPH